MFTHGYKFNVPTIKQIKQVTDKVLSGMPIKRLQALLKAVRTKASAYSHCDCCGEPLISIYPNDEKIKNDLKINQDYLQKIKDELHRKQQ